MSFSIYSIQTNNPNSYDSNLVINGRFVVNNSTNKIVHFYDLNQILENGDYKDILLPENTFINVVAINNYSDNTFTGFNGTYFTDKGVVLDWSNYIVNNYNVARYFLRYYYYVSPFNEQNEGGLVYDASNNYYYTLIDNIRGQLSYTISQSTISSPSISSLNISTVSAVGGQTITINGSNFKYSPVVKVDGVIVASTLVSSTQITFVTPEHIAGTVNITVTNDGGTSNSLTFTYFVPAPTITNLDISSLSILGGKTITIMGTNFITNPLVKLDGVIVSSTLVSSTQMTFIAPSHNAGSVSITVTNDEGTSNSINLNYIDYPISNVCFPTGTLINTDQGIIPIEKINPAVHTIQNNNIETITKTITQDSYLVCIEKDALSKNIPSEKTIISKNHKLFYNGSMISAKNLMNRINDDSKLHKVNYTGEILYNVLLENKHDKMIVNNLICETLDPQNGIAIMYSFMKKVNFNFEEKQQFIKRYNSYVKEHKIFSK
jgi:hypothetical protein